MAHCRMATVRSKCALPWTSLTTFVWSLLITSTFLDSYFSDGCETCVENWPSHTNSLPGIIQATEMETMRTSAWNQIVPENKFSYEYSSWKHGLSSAAELQKLANVQVQTVSPAPSPQAAWPSIGAPTPAYNPKWSSPNSSPPQTGPFLCGICGHSHPAGIGDTLPSVAVYCNVSLYNLTQLNPSLPSGSVIAAGTTINVPCTNSSWGKCTTCGASYTVQSGDTISLLSQSCNLTLLNMEDANPDIDYSNIYPGQFVNVPCAGGAVIYAVQGCGVCGIRYIVQQNGNISMVSSQCGISLSQLINANPVANSSGLILAGQVLHVPCSGKNPSNCGLCGSTYTAVLGDNILTVAAKCRVGAIELQEMNPSLPLSNLQNGTRVTIPCDSLPVPQVCSKCSPNFSVISSSDINSIAAQCNVSANLVAYANNLPLSGVVPVGRSLSIPCATLPRRNYRNCGVCGSMITLQVQVSLYTIAEACGSTVDAIREQNVNFTIDTLAPKDQIALPCNYTDFGCGPCGIGYKVVDGDTLASVAVKCATMAGDVQKVNPLMDFSELIENMMLNMPCTGPQMSNSATSRGLLRPYSLTCWYLDLTKSYMFSILVMLALSMEFFIYL